MAVEIAMFVVGVAIYARTTRAINWRGVVALWSLVVLLALFYAMTCFGPPPSSVDFIKYGGLTGWLFVPWAWWIDRNREIAPSARVDGCSRQLRSASSRTVH